MTTLKKRREKVEKLTELARRDNIRHKYRQGLYILEQIAQREIEYVKTRNPFLIN